MIWKESPDLVKWPFPFGKNFLGKNDLGKNNRKSKLAKNYLADTLTPNDNKFNASKSILMVKKNRTLKLEKGSSNVEDFPGNLKKINLESYPWSTVQTKVSQQ